MIVLFSWCFLDVFSIVMKDINEWSEITHLRLWGRFWQILTAGSQLACQLYYCQAISWGPSSSEWSQRNILGDMVRCLLNTLAFHHKSPCCVMPSSSRLLIALSFFWRLCRSPTFSRELLQCDSSRPCLQDLDLRKVWVGSCATSRTLAVWSVLSAFETRLPEGSLDRAVHHSVAQCTTSVQQQLQCMHRQALLPISRRVCISVGQRSRKKTYRIWQWNHWLMPDTELCDAFWCFLLSVTGRSKLWMLPVMNYVVCRPLTWNVAMIPSQTTRRGLRTPKSTNKVIPTES